MPEFNLNYENISVDYNANKEDTAGGNTLGGGDIILVDIHGGEGGSFAEIDESNLAGGGKTIAGWGVGGIEADGDDGDHDIIFDPDGDLLPPNKPTGGGGDDAPDSILWDLDGGHVPGGGSEYLVHGVDGESNGQELVFGLSASGDYADTGMHDGMDSSGHDPIADMLSRQENVSEDATGTKQGGGDILLIDLMGTAAAVETEIHTSDGYIIVWDDLGAAAAAETGDFTENSAEGGMLMLVDSFDPEQDYQTSAEPYGQFNFIVEMGGDASTGPADAFFVSTDASTVTESAPSAGQEIGGGEIILVDIRGGEGGYAESEERGLGGVTIYSDINDDPSGQNDSFDFTAQPGNQEVPVPPDEIIIMPDPTCPPEQILDDRGYSDFLGQEGDSAASGGGGDFILVDILPPLVTSGVDDLGLI